jgi:hypothetical protein
MLTSHTSEPVRQVNWTLLHFSVRGTLTERAVKLKAVILAGIMALVLGRSVHAHHAFARFDTEREVTLRGTVRAFHWTSPHAWIMLTVEGTHHSEQWAIEMDGASGLARHGWNPGTLTPGMAVRTTIRPLRDGTNGGHLLELMLPDGTILGQATGAP